MAPNRFHGAPGRHETAAQSPTEMGNIDSTMPFDNRIAPRAWRGDKAQHRDIVGPNLTARAPRVGPHDGERSMSDVAEAARRDRAMAAYRR